MAAPGRQLPLAMKKLTFGVARTPRSVDRQLPVVLATLPDRQLRPTSSHMRCSVSISLDASGWNKARMTAAQARPMEKEG